MRLGAGRAPVFATTQTSGAPGPEDECLASSSLTSHETSRHPPSDSNPHSSNHQDGRDSRLWFRAVTQVRKRTSTHRSFDHVCTHLLHTSPNCPALGFRGTKGCNAPELSDNGSTAQRSTDEGGTASAQIETTCRGSQKRIITAQEQRIQELTMSDTRQTVHTPCWSTSSSGRPADITPCEAAALGEHLNLCISQRTPWQVSQLAADRLKALVAGRVVTSAIAMTLITLSFWPVI